MESARRQSSLLSIELWQRPFCNHAKANSKKTRSTISFLFSISERLASSFLATAFRVLEPPIVDEDGLEPWQRELLPLYKAAMWLHLMHLASGANLDDIAAKQSLSLLKCIPIIPADKATGCRRAASLKSWSQAFYLSGIKCRAAGRIDMAVALLNRYLDIIDAMEEGDSSPLLENTPFKLTEIP